MTDLERLTDDWRSADNEYKSTLFKYAFLILSAELAIVGFLLQNEITQKIMKHGDMKLIFISSFAFASFSLLASVLYKKLRRSYEKNTMHSEQYSVMQGRSIKVLGEEMTIASTDSQTRQLGHAQKAVTSLNRADIMFTFAEICLGLSVISGAIFVCKLLYSI